MDFWTAPNLTIFLSATSYLPCLTTSLWTRLFFSTLTFGIFFSCLLGLIFWQKCALKNSILMILRRHVSERTFMSSLLSKHFLRSYFPIRSSEKNRNFRGMGPRVFSRPFETSTVCTLDNDIFRFRFFIRIAKKATLLDIF